MAGNCGSLTCSRQDTPITVGSHFGSRRTALQRDQLPSGIGRSALTCEDTCAGAGCEGPSAALAMQEVKDHLQDRNMLLNCGNVELRGFEPLTSCMPYRPVPSLDGARCLPACRLPAMTVAVCGLMSPGAWRRWLPTWLPANPLARLTLPANRTQGRPANAPTVSWRARDEQELQGCSAAVSATTSRIPVTPGPSSTSFEGRNDADSSRTPLRLARRTRPIWQSWEVPALSGLLPPSPAPPGSGCPQLQRPAATGRRRRSLTSARTTAPHGARRTAWKPLVMVMKRVLVG